MAEREARAGDDVAVAGLMAGEAVEKAVGIGDAV
jgi:hypothetical protein